MLRSRLPRAVWLLGWISLANDAATEAIYPLLPMFLTQVLGAGPVSLGLVEGVAEAVNSGVKIFAGRLSDRARASKLLVLLGYAASAVARPFIAVATSWTQVLGIRVLDRIGKGVRTAPRDAMLAEWATPTTRGKVYGFHRGMDNLGAVIGPLAATGFLLTFPGQYRSLFALTIVPGVISTLLILLLPSRNDLSRRHEDHEGTRSTFSTTEPLPREFSSFMWVLVLFAIGNSTDAFLLLKLTDAAGSVRFVPLIWASFNSVKTVVSMIAGSWSDRIGRKKVIAIGWLIYAFVYAGFAMSQSLPALLSWFVVYGFYYGFAESAEKALVADLAPASRRGFAFGIYNAIVGLGMLAASVLFGLVWSAFGTAVAFAFGASLAIAATLLLFLVA